MVARVNTPTSARRVSSARSNSTVSCELKPLARRGARFDCFATSAKLWVASSLEVHRRSANLSRDEGLRAPRDVLRRPRWCSASCAVETVRVDDQNHGL